jgi:hypothetical protein
MVVSVILDSKSLYLWEQISKMQRANLKDANTQKRMEVITYIPLHQSCVLSQAVDMLHAWGRGYNLRGG